MTNNAFRGKSLVETYIEDLPASQRTKPRYFASDGESLLVIEEISKSPEEINFGGALLYRVDFMVEGDPSITLLT